MDNEVPDWAQESSAPSVSTTTSGIPDWAQDTSPAVKPVTANQSESDYWHNTLANDPDKEYGSVLPFAKDKKTGKVSLAAPEMVRSVAHGIGDLFQQAETKSTDATPDSVNAMLAMSGIRPALSGIGNAADASLAARPLSNIEAAAVDPQIARQARNFQYINGLNKNADLMKGVYDESTGKTAGGYGEIYDKAKEISNGVSIKAPKMQNSIDDLLEDLENDPAHKTSQGSSQAFRDLKAVSDSFDGDGNMPLDSATLLKKRINDLYDPKMSDTRGKIYAQLNNQINGVIKRAKVENPEWGDLMDSGNNLFLNYKKTFGDSNNWSLSDKKEYEDALSARKNDPHSAPPADEVRSKINDISNVKNLQEYETMLRKLPPEMHEQFTKDVIQNQPKNSRLANALKGIYKAAIGNKFGSANAFYNAVAENSGKAIDPLSAQSYPHVQDAVKYHSDVANQAYKKYLDDVQAAQNPPDGPIKLLTEQRPMVGGRGKPVRPATDEEWQAQIDRAKQDAELGTSTDLRKVQAKNARTQYEKENPAGEFFNKISRSPFRVNQTALNPESVGLEESPFDSGFKRGGAVNRTPSEAQKAAGNYKKDHIKLHGFDISIENPKGSKRSGTSKDGKEWSVVMPHHYGYIRGTIGADKDHLDCYVGPDTKSKRVYIIDQKDDHAGRFDEHKIMFNFTDRDAAIKAYRSAFSDKKNRIMKVTRFTIPELKDWLKKGNTKHPARKAV